MVCVVAEESRKLDVAERKQVLVLHKLDVAERTLDRILRIQKAIIRVLKLIFSFLFPLAHINLPVC